MLKRFIKHERGKKTLLICVLVLLAYTLSYSCLRLSKLLVHQEVAIVEKTGLRVDGQAVVYTIFHDIGRGSYTDENNYNAIKPPSTAVQIGKCLYFPFVKLEVAYWRLKSPRYIFESTCTL